MLTRPVWSVAMSLFVWGLFCPGGVIADTQRVSYFILAQTAEPLMIVREGDPMAGGLFTEIVEEVFRDSDYMVTPTVMPWVRMTEELKRRDDWVMHGIPAFFEPDIPYELSDVAVFPFDHVAVTLRSHDFPVTKPSDIFGRTVILVENFHYTGLDAYLSNPVVGTGSGDVVSVRAFNPEGTLRMLRHRRGDLVIGWRARLIYNLPAAGLTMDDVHVQDASGIVPTTYMHFAFSPSWSDEFKKHVNDRLRRMQSDGTLARILAKYSRPRELPQ